MVGVAAAARFLGCSRDDVYRLCEQQLMPHGRSATSNALRFDPADLAALRDSKLRPA